ncbi:hypothetical protein FB45DRAFT_1067588 [Roridomyces roridus]|uniref:DUF6534 domain-containing protein n=1 Tax=Roridomyces roridus TaxID=1738132 RepID=A0AAD7B2J9_9AGAR|nr:hypothetical protein FB45DRAFT_1067588 [Roridomyces roridus]
MPRVDLLYGSMLIGSLLNMVLYGVLLTQIPAAFIGYMKRNTPGRDFPWFRYLIGYLATAATANVIIQCGIIYQPLIIQYGEPQSFVFSPLLMPGEAFMISMVAAPIQLFTAWRLKVLTARAFGSGMALSIMVVLDRQFRDFPKFATVTTVWLSLTASCDVVIAAAMSFTLLTRTREIEIQRINPELNGKINRIIRLTLVTGSFTALGSLADVVIFHIFPKTTLNFIVNFPLSSIYILSLLALLNVREREQFTQSRDTQLSPAARSQPRVQILSLSVDGLSGDTHGCIDGWTADDLCSSLGG